MPPNKALQPTSLPLVATPLHSAHGFGGSLPAVSCLKSGLGIRWIEVSNAGVGKMVDGYNWLLDEVASAGRENRDVKHASQYDAKEDAAALEELTLLKELGLNEQSEVVDMGAGTGQFALAAASTCARVVAVDA